MTNTANMNYDAFSHGQIKSKLWLCETLEPHLPILADVAILGSWYNVLGFMMLTRNQNRYSSITGIDVDSKAITIANKICNYWTMDNVKIRNLELDANSVVFDFCTVVINCSAEHMRSARWYENIPSGSLVCIQSSNVTEINDPWFIQNPSHSISNFASKYPLTTTLFLDTLPIRYQSWGYDRYMVIGIK